MYGIILAKSANPSAPRPYVPPEPLNLLSPKLPNFEHEERYIRHQDKIECKHNGGGG